MSSSVLGWFIRNIRFNPLLNTAGAANASRMVLYNNTAENVQAIVPLNYQEVPVQNGDTLGGGLGVADQLAVDNLA